MISDASFTSASLICFTDSFFAIFESELASLTLASKFSISSVLSVGSIFMENIAPVFSVSLASHPISILDG